MTVVKRTNRCATVAFGCDAIDARETTDDRRECERIWIGTDCRRAREMRETWDATVMR